MFKVFIVFLFVLFVANKQLNAQNYVSDKTLNVGFDASIGTTTKRSPFGYGLAFDLLLKYKLSEELSSIGSVGYTRLLTKDTSPIADYDFLPVKVAVKIFPTPANLYLTGLTGAGFGLRKGVKTSFLFGGGLGYQLEGGYDIGLKYEGCKQNKNAITYQPLNGQFAFVFAYFF